MSWFSILKDDEGDDYSYPNTDYKQKLRRTNLKAKKRKIRELENKMSQLKNRQILPSTSIYEIEERKKEYKKLKRKLSKIKNA